MVNAIQATQGYFESSSSRTPEYLLWHRLFKKEFTTFLKSKEVSDIEIGKPNHFDMSGFFKKEDQIYWFRIEDLRWSKDTMLIRTAKHFKDYSGGSNCFVRLNNPTMFEKDFDTIMTYKERR